MLFLIVTKYRLKALKKQQNANAASRQYTAAELLEKAEEMMAKFDYELAQKVRKLKNQRVFLF
jgi:hypothetical protein